MPVNADEDGPVDYDKITDQIIESKPWEGLIETQNSEADKLIKSTSHFNKYQQSLLGMFSQISNVEKPYKCVLDMPMIEQDKVVLYAILCQNALQPKNKQRTEAISSKIYKEITCRADADEFLGTTLREQLKNELRGVESEV